jgi:hypothetical protein
VTADAFLQITEMRRDNNAARVHVAIEDARVGIVESAE